MSKFLLVDDDVQLGLQLTDYFAQKSIKLEVVTTGLDALQLLANFEFELILLDWMLPDITGLEVCKRFRERGGKTHIIFLTGENFIENKEQGLSAGGDDYLVKPFDIRELMARTKSVLRRSIEIAPEVKSVKGVTFEVNSRRVTYDGNSVMLTPTEAMLLDYLVRHVNRPFNAQKLLTALWPTDTDAEVGTVRTSMHYLRNKLAQIGQKDFVKSVTSSGYVVEE